MPTSTSTTSSSSKASTSSAGPFTADLKAKLAASQSATIFVPLEGGGPPTDDELKALAADGLHAEHDAVRDALAVRAATEDEIAAAKGAEAQPAASSTPASSSTTSA